jgi:hypothetical protein
VLPVLKEYEIKLSLDNNSITYETPYELPAEVLELLKRNKRKLIAWLKTKDQIEEMFSKAMYSLDDFYSNGSFCSTKNPAEFDILRNDTMRPTIER